MPIKSCRSCGTLKAGTDPCTNPECSRPRTQVRHGSRSVISMTSPHGFHAPAAVGPWHAKYAASQGRA